MPKNMELKIAYAYYVNKYTDDQILKLFNIRPKTLRRIIAEYKDQFKEG